MRQSSAIIVHDLRELVTALVNGFYVTGDGRFIGFGALTGGIRPKTKSRHWLRLFVQLGLVFRR